MSERPPPTEAEWTILEQLRALRYGSLRVDVKAGVPAYVARTETLKLPTAWDKEIQAVAEASRR